MGSNLVILWYNGKLFLVLNLAKIDKGVWLISKLPTFWKIPLSATQFFGISN